MKYGCVDDCKSPLGKRLMQWRAERPSEWLMDEFICEAEEQQEEIERLIAQAQRLLEALEQIAENDQGQAGYIARAAIQAATKESTQ